MIGAIRFLKNAESNYYNDLGEKLEFLDQLNKVNILVGENNSGKSRFMRSILAIMQNQYYKTIQELDESHRTRSIPPTYLDKFEGLSTIKTLEAVKVFRATNGTASEKYSLDTSIRGLESYIQKSKIQLSNDDMCYIPTLRGVEKFDNYFTSLFDSPTMAALQLNHAQMGAVESFSNNAKRIYENKVSSVYNIKRKNIFTAENLYDDLVGRLLGSELDRGLVKSFEEFISDTFFEGVPLSLNPHIANKSLYVKIGNNSDMLLSDMGDGIKQIISMFYKIFTMKNSETIFLIEEPELNLHPGLQRKVINVLCSDLFPKAQFFITTHSNHILDYALTTKNVSIYHFINLENSNNRFQVSKTTRNDLRVLETLGVRNTSVFLANHTIWVEGLSDKIYISKYFSVYLKSIDCENKYTEGGDYAFVEYEGSNIVHWNFDQYEVDGMKTNARQISNSILVIVDNDNDTKKKRKEGLRKVLGDSHFYELNVREIENTIKTDILEKTLFGGAEPKYKKEKRQSYNNKRSYVGKYIDDNYELPKSYSSETGTVKDKIGLASKIVQNINSINDLSEEAIKICEKIYGFLNSSH